MRNILLSTMLSIFVILVAPIASSQDAASILQRGVYLDQNCQIEDLDQDREAWFAAITAAAEARQDGPLGMILVLEVIANRVCDGRYGGRSAEAVTTARNQFSPWRHDSGIRDDLVSLANHRPSKRPDLDRATEQIFPIAKEILKGWRTGKLPYGAENPTLHFVNLSLACPRWARNGRPAFVHGGHTFYVGVDTQPSN